MDNNNHILSSSQQEIDLIALAAYLWKRKRLLLKCCGIAVVTGLIVAFSLPKEYTTTVKLAPETTDATSKMGNLGGLAAMAGIGCGAGCFVAQPLSRHRTQHPFPVGAFPRKGNGQGKEANDVFVRLYG